MSSSAQAKPPLAQNFSSLQALQKQASSSSQPVAVNDSVDNLNVFGNVLDEVIKTTPQAVTTTLKHADEKNLNPSNPVGSAKEKVEVGAGVDSSIIDATGGVQVVEQEKTPEIPVEVESYLHRVEDHVEQAPQEIVIADGTIETTQANYPTTPVVILPITQEEEKKGKRKSPKHSFRWLVEWSHKIIKLFAGKVIYRQVEKKEQ